MKKYFAINLFVLLLSPLFAHASVVLGNSSTATVGAGLVAYWPLDGNTTSWTTDTTRDITGNGNTGNLVSMSTSTSPTPGKIGGALKFASNYINVSPYPSTTNPLTVSAWVYPTSLSQASLGSGTGGTIIDENEGGGAAGWDFGVKSTGVLWFWPSGSNDKFSTNTVPLNKWTYVTATYDGTSVRFYINGVLDSTQTMSAPQGSATFFRIGNDDWITGYWAGNLDDVRVYNRALSAQEVAQLYTNGGGVLAHSNAVTLSSGLVGYWPLDGNTTNWATDTTRDISGSGSTGTLTLLSTTTSPVVGKIGGALQFNGSTQYAQSTSPYTGVANWTLSAWIKPAVLPQLSQAVYNGNDAGGYGFGVGNGAGASGSKLQVLFGSVSWLDPGYNLTAGQWYHVVMTRDSATTRLYVNGVLLATTFSNTPVSLVNKFNMGMEPDGSNNPYRYFNGTIDDVRIYTRALSAGEVQQLYVAGGGVLGHSNTITLGSGLVDYWPLDGNTTNWATDTTRDTSGSNNGSLSNMSTTTSPVPGKIGGALKFDGSTQTINVGNISPTKSLPFSAALWFKISSANGALINKYVSSSWNGFNLFFVGGKLCSWYTTGTTNNNYTAIAQDGGVGSVGCVSVSTGVWHHVVVTVSSAGMTMYIDGAAAATSGWTGTVTNSSESTAMNFGQYITYFGGSMDDVRIYTRALSASEANQLYLAGK